MSRTQGLWKVEGAGNDFVLGLGAWARRLADDEQLVVDLCDRRRGIGADGVLAIEKVNAAEFVLRYRNADGSKARFCANGTRCAALAAHRLLGLEPGLTVHTDWVDIPATVEAQTVRLELPTPARREEIELPVGSTIWRGHRLAVGVEHVVLACDDPSLLDMAVIAPPLRHHEILGPDGANISFVGPLLDGVRSIRTWERGVEGETLCCGSAVVAAGWLFTHENVSASSTMRARSGDLLVVKPHGDGVRLTGPARIVAEVRMYPEG